MSKPKTIQYKGYFIISKNVPRNFEWIIVVRNPEKKTIGRRSFGWVTQGEIWAKELVDSDINNNAENLV